MDLVEVPAGRGRAAFLVNPDHVSTVQAHLADLGGGGVELIVEIKVVGETLHRANFGTYASAAAAQAAYETFCNALRGRSVERPAEFVQDHKDRHDRPEHVES